MFTMARTGPIIIVEDDADDEAVFSDILKELEVPNKIIWFGNSGDAFDYLKTTSDRPFLIFSDVNLPGENGIEFKRRIDQDKQLREKSIPFVFYSTSIDKWAVTEAYTKMTVQGFFKKGSSYEEIKTHIGLIFDYWQICQHPNA
jgi:CheY-like chemotaxis protein